MPFSRTIEWFEDLPENCPPNNAYSPNHDRFFRLAKQYPPTERDFFSHRKLYPMNRKIKHKESLIYYDGPQLFLARDQVNAQYLCLLVEDTNEFNKFLCVPISFERLENFYREQIDLRKIYEEPESGELFYAEITETVQGAYQLVPVSFDSLPKEWLPEPGFIFKPERIKQELTGKVIKADSKLGGLDAAYNK